MEGQYRKRRKRRNNQFSDVIESIDKQLSRSDHLMKLITVFVEDQLYLHVQVKLTEDWFLHSEKHLPTGAWEGALGQHGTHCEKKGETDSTVVFSGTEEICRDCPLRQTRMAKREYQMKSWNDDEQLPADQFEWTVYEIDSREKTIRPIN